MRLEAHETKEKATKEQGSDASQKKQSERLNFLSFGGPKDGFCWFRIMLRTEGRKQNSEKSIIVHEKVMLDLKCLECTENGIRFLSSFRPKNENMHGIAARSIFFCRRGPAKEAKWVHNGGKKSSYQGRLGSENDICNAMCSKSICKIMLPAEGGWCELNVSG